MIPEHETAWFCNLYTIFSRHLVNLGVRYGVEPEISKELIQESFLRLLVKYDEVKAANKNIPGWLIKTDHNFIRRELDSARRKYEIALRMNISEGYVGVLLSRALKEFRKRYLSEESRFEKGIHLPT